MTEDQQRLIGLWQEMSEQQRARLLDYAEFLQHRSRVSGDDAVPQQKLQPDHRPRPDKENVINAIKRLRATYYMLNTNALFNQVSSLMTQFMVHGRDSVEVIDDLEALFEEYFQRYLEP